MQAVARPGTVYLVGAGPGAPDLLTLRAWRLLHDCDVIVHDSLVRPEAYADVRVRCVDAGKRAGDHGIGQDGIHALLIELARSGQRVVRLKGGDPYVLGRGSEEAIALAEAGVPCEVVPGVSSSLAAPLLAGIPLTHRGLAESFCVVSAHPQHAGDQAAIPPFDARRTLVVLMGVHTLPQWLPLLPALGYPPDWPIAFVQQASWPGARSFVTTVARCAEDATRLGARSPSVIVLGAVVTLRASLPHEVP